MKLLLKRILLNLHRYVVWALVSVLLWTWIFFLVTDTKRGQKVTVFVDLPYIDEDAVAAELKKELPQGLRTVKAHTLSYLMFDSDPTDSGDVMILPGSIVPEYADRLCTLTETFGGEFRMNGEAYGWLLFDGETRTGSACSLFDFPEDGESFYICFPKSSPHLGELNGSADDAAVVIAKRILALP